MNTTHDVPGTIHWFLSAVGPMITAAETARSAVARRSAPHFTSFRFIAPDENGLSDILSHFLDPSELHGQSDVFLRVLLNRIGLEGANTEKVAVRREASAGTGGGFIDILIEAPAWRIVIENKPWAGDQPSQLQRYWSHVTRQGFKPSKCRVLYLSANGRPPSESSLAKGLREELSSDGPSLYGFSLGPIDEANQDAVSYPILPFDGLLQAWISAARPSHVRNFLDEFADHLTSAFGEAEDHMREKSEALADMIRQSRAMTEAALQTADAAHYLREGIRNDFFRALEDDVLLAMGDRGELSDRISNSEETYRSFRYWFYSDTRLQLVHPMFELYRNGRLLFGVRAPNAKSGKFKKAGLDEKPVPEDTRNELSNAVEHLLPNAKSNVWWASFQDVTSDWPNLDTSEGMLFMLDALENRHAPNGTIPDMVARALELAEAVDRYFRQRAARSTGVNKGPEN